MKYLIKSFFLQAKKVSCKKGQTILHPNRITYEIYFIETGYVKNYTLTQSGEEKIHCFYKAENIFPLQCLADNVTVKDYYDSLTDVQLRTVTKNDLLSYVNSNKDAMQELFDEMGHYLDLCENRVTYLQYTSPYDRLTARLLFMAERFGQKNNSDIFIDVPITHKDIASSINTTRETVNKELIFMEKSGLITYSRNHIIIHNIEKLRQEIPENTNK